MRAEKPIIEMIHPERHAERRSLWRLWCTACARLVNMMEIERAASLSGLLVEALLERIDSRGLHYMRKQSGNLLICFDSLFRSHSTIVGKNDSGTDCPEFAQADAQAYGLALCPKSHIKGETTMNTLRSISRYAVATAMIVMLCAMAAAAQTSGTPGKIPKFKSGSTFGNSEITEDKNGKIGIGKDLPTSKLIVQGVIESLGGFRFPDGTMQTTATTSGLQSVSHDATLTGDGTQAMPLGVAVPLVLNGDTANNGPAIIEATNAGAGAAIRGISMRDAISGQTQSDSSFDGGVVGSSSGGSTGVIGRNFGNGVGVSGFSMNGTGVQAMASNGGTGLHAFSSGDGSVGVFALSETGGSFFGHQLGLSSVGGDKSNQTGGVGVDAFGGDSDNSSGGIGVRATGGNSSSQDPINRGGEGVLAIGGDGPIGGAALRGVGGLGTGAGGQGGVGIRASGGNGINGATQGLAGLFNGDVEIGNNLSVIGTKNFKIDHPLDPENKYLYHAAIESSEVLNVYSGNVTTDYNGDATVTLPDWFEAPNRDFRYQLTVVGTFAQAIVSDEIKDNRFQIKTNDPGVKVSWLVTSIRSDAAMRRNPFKVEEDKPERERGFFLSPEAHGHSEERGIEWARDPELMQQLKQQRVEAARGRSTPLDRSQRSSRISA